MNIEAIQTGMMTQNANRPAEKIEAKSGGREGAAAAGGSANTDLGRRQLDEIMYSYPPFFPLATYQRADLIRKIQTLQDEILKKAAETGSSALQAQPRITEQATDQEISSALEGLKNAMESAVSGLTDKGAGAILSIKV